MRPMVCPYQCDDGYVPTSGGGLHPCPLCRPFEKARMGTRDRIFLSVATAVFLILVSALWWVPTIL